MSTMEKWPVQKQTHRTAQKHTEYQDATAIQNILCCCVVRIFLLFYDFLNDLKAEANAY